MTTERPPVGNDETQRAYQVNRAYELNRRQLLWAGPSALALVFAAGCRGFQYGHIIDDNQKDLVGSHAAGAAVFNPLIDQAVGALLTRQAAFLQTSGHAPDGQLSPKAICFVGVENKSIEEIGDFKEQIYEQIDTQIVQSQIFRPISRRWVDAALQQTRMRPDALMIPENMRMFSAVMEQSGQPFDYLLFATITSGTTVRNNSEQRDYLLTLELLNMHTGQADKESAKIRQGYHGSRAGAWWNYNLFKRKS